MGNVERPKQFMEVGGKPIIVHTIEKFAIHTEFDKIIITEDITIDEEFIYQRNRDKLNLLKSQIESELDEAGLEGVFISVNGDIFDKQMKIENVFVDLSLLVITDKTKHIDIEKTVKDAVRKFVTIEEEKIILND